MVRNHKNDFIVTDPTGFEPGDLTLRKRSHYPSYATSPNSLRERRLIWIAISHHLVVQRHKGFHQVHEMSRQLARK